MKLAIALLMCLGTVVARASAADRPMNDAMIWTAEAPPEKGFVHAAFRKTFDLAAAPRSATLRLFAYTRYVLFINGEYVCRGPNRFETARPEFDAIDVASRLRTGANVIAILVHRDLPSGRVRQHAPGLTARLDVDGATTLATDPSWHAFIEPTYGPTKAVWASFTEERDVRRSAGDWTDADFDAAALPLARIVDTSDAAVWPEPQPRTIPLLRETTIDAVARLNATTRPSDEAVDLAPGDELVIDAPRIVQAYWSIEIDAPAGVTIEARPLLPEGATNGVNRYVTRAGRQRWIANDTWGMKSLSLKAIGGTVTLSKVRLVEVLYPFDIVGRFASSDPLLDRVWSLGVRTVQLLSEDAYVDCADRERVEWMDCDPPAFDVTRVALAAPGDGGRPRFGDARLMKNLLLRTALTQRDDGMVKAHTCSERWDLHAIMEDRACDWVEGLRKYSDATGDDAFIREMWPHLDRLLTWFLDRRSPERGLVVAREWICWDNPISYATCEGAANNAFVYRALLDGAAIAERIGRDDDAARLRTAADRLAADFDRTLWIDAAGAYGAAVGPAEIKPQDRMFRKTIELARVGDALEPTLHANLFALDRGIVPPARRDRVVAWVLAHDAQIRQIMAQHLYFKLLYALDAPADDQRVLDRIRGGWKIMADSPWGTAWESLGEGSKIHVYGALPAYTLSTFVLGVRRDAPIWEKRLVVQPHLADLAHVEGTVSSEFGLIDVSWMRDGDAVRGSVGLPDGIETTLLLPAGAKGVVRVDGRAVPREARGRWRRVTLAGGAHEVASE